MVGAIDEIVANKNILTNKIERSYTITKMQNDVLSSFGLAHDNIDRVDKAPYSNID